MAVSIKKVPILLSHGIVKTDTIKIDLQLSKEKINGVNHKQDWS